MKKTTLAAAFAVSTLLTGCSIRMGGFLETEDAVYGKTVMEKEQKYDSKHLGFVESLMGAVNSDSLNALDRIVNGAAEQAPRPAPTPVVVTPVPSGTSVIVQP